MCAHAFAVSHRAGPARYMALHQPHLDQVDDLLEALVARDQWNLSDHGRSGHEAIRQLQFGRSAQLDRYRFDGWTEWNDWLNKAVISSMSRTVELGQDRTSTSVMNDTLARKPRIASRTAASPFRRSMSTLLSSTTSSPLIAHLSLDLYGITF